MGECFQKLTRPFACLCSMFGIQLSKVPQIFNYEEEYHKMIQKHYDQHLSSLLLIFFLIMIVMLYLYF